MNTINRNYTSVPGLSAPGTLAEPERLQLVDKRAGDHCNMIDFRPPQKVSGMQSSLNMSNAKPPSPDRTYNSTGGQDELRLNKLVEAIHNILQELFSLLRGNKLQGAAPSRSLAQSEPPRISQLPPTTTSALSLSGGTARSSLPSLTPETGSTEAVNTPARNDAIKAGVVNDLTAPKASSTAIENPDTPQKLVKATPLVAAQGQGADMSGIVGFAKESNTTGGNKGEVVTVKTAADLKKYMEDDTPRIVRLGANLSADSKMTINFGANKTLLGTDGGNSLHNIYLASGKTASNDIFQNLNFTHDSRYRKNGDMQMFISSGKNYWIDHNTYTGTKDQNPKGLDKLLYVGGTADNVSLTNSKFQNNEYGVILGQPDDSAAAKATYAGYPRMTIANNEFNNLDVRAPGLMRHGYFDVYNNLIDNFHLGFTATGDANILSQANYFEHGSDSANRPSNKGVLDDYGDAHFKDIGSNVSFTQKSPITTWRPSYNRDVRSAEDAKAFDLANAGATTENNGNS
ncbi:type III helper protein HopAK1 [Pantoea stewartii]